VPTTKLTPFVVSEDEWDTKEGPGKSMKNALYILQCAKRHTKQRQIVKEIKPIAFKLRLSEGIRQLVSWLVGWLVS